MALAITPSGVKSIPHRISIFIGMSLEAEIRSLYGLSPESMNQLATLFSESVVESCSAVAGVSSGEALVRRIGDERLRDPESAFKRIDELLGGGSDTLKRVIDVRFRSKVRRLYRMSINLEAKRFSAH